MKKNVVYVHLASLLSNFIVVDFPSRNLADLSYSRTPIFCSQSIVAPMLNWVAPIFRREKIYLIKTGKTILKGPKNEVLGAYGTFEWTPNSESAIQVGYFRFKPNTDGIMPRILIDPRPQNQLFPVDRRTNWIEWGVLKTQQSIVGHLAIHELLKPLNWFYEQIHGSGLRILASSGNENIYFNQGIWAYQNGVVYGYPNLSNETPMLVVWKNGKTDMQNMHLEMNAAAPEIFIDRINRTEEIKEASTVIPILKNGAYFSPANVMWMYDDKRHLFKMPKLTHEDVSVIPLNLMSEGVFFGFSQLEASDGLLAKKAFNQSIKLKTEVLIASRDGNGNTIEQNVNLSTELLTQKLTNLGYQQVRDPKQQGDFRFASDDEIEIFLLPNRYPFNAIGFTRNGEFINVVAGGQSGQTGVTVRELAFLMKHLGAVDAAIVDQGVSARLTVGEEHLVLDALRKSGQRSLRLVSILAYVVKDSLKVTTKPNHQLNPSILRSV